MGRLLKRIGIGLGFLAALLVVAAGVLYAVGSFRVGRTFEVETAALDVPDDEASVARGAHLARINGCTECHGPDLSGQVMLDVPPFRATAANLTSGAGGIGGRYSDADWDRTIRHGVKPDGRPVIIMPSAAFHALGDEDAGALIAYLKSLPPVDNELPPTEIRAVGRLAAVFQDFAMEVRSGRAGPEGAPPAAVPTAEYGAYLTSGICAYCHGEGLRGNAEPPIPGSPPAPDLAAAGRWRFDQFERALRTGVAPGGRTLDPEYMPWSMTAAMEEDELRAIHAHLSTLAGEAAAP